MTDDQTYTLAHTAQCKLKLAAKRPDRNLRFILGHAFTYESVLHRIVQIEESDTKVQKQKHHHSHEHANEPAERRVSFHGNSNAPPRELREHTEQREKNGKTGRHVSPPPGPPNWNIDGSDGDENEDAFEDDEEDDNPSLGLTRFGSATARPPHQRRDSDSSSSSSSSEEEDELPSPPQIPSESEIGVITAEEGDENLAGLYDTVRNCGCQVQVEGKAPAISSMWEIPPASTEKNEEGMSRAAIIRVTA